MARTLSAEFTTEKNKTANSRPVPSFVFHFGGAVGDIYVADRTVTIGGNAHTGALHNAGEYQSSIAIRSGTFSVKQMPVELINFPIFPNNKRFTDLWQGVGPEGIEVDVYENLKDDGGVFRSDLLFKAVMRPDEGEYDPHRCSFNLLSISEKYLEKKEVSFPINNTDFPNADLDDIGKRANVVIGSVKKARAHAVVAGPSSTLRVLMIPADSAVPIHDEFYDAVPSAGTVQVGNEKIFYSSKSGAPGSRALTGITRGFGGTAIETHLKDDSILQVLTEYVYLAAGKKLKSISRVYVKRGQKEIPLAAGQYTVELANTTLVPGKTLSLIKFSSAPLIAEKDFVKIDDSIGTSDTIAVTPVNSETKWTQYAADQTTVFSFSGPTVADFATSMGAQDKTITSGFFSKTLAIRVNAVTGIPVFSLGIVDANGTEQTLIQSGSAGQSATGSFISLFHWGVAVRLRVTSNPGTVSVYIGGKQVSYNISNGIIKSGTVTKTGAATLPSTSTADLVIGDAVLFDAEGCEDDGSGTYTGSANALVEKPADAIHYVAREVIGIPASLVDAASFATARTDAPSSYKFGFVISERTQAKELFLAMGMQSRIDVDWPVDKLRARFKKSVYPAPSKVITEKNIVAEGPLRGVAGARRTTLRIRRGEAADIINTVSVYYGREWNKGRGRDAFKKVTQRAQNAASVARYGEREQADRFWFDMIGESNSAMAEDLRDFYKDYLAEAPRVLSATTMLDQYELLPGDVVGINFYTRPVPAGGGTLPYTLPFLITAGGEQFDGLTGEQKFLIEDVRVMPGNYRDKRITHTAIVAREVP